MSKYVYSFGDGKAEGSASDKLLLGGKGANLAEMTNIEIPVPPGFTISTDVCRYYYDNGHQYPDSLRAEVDEAIKLAEQRLGKGFGDASNPLLVSVRSGAAVSMPGMMDTILNLGINAETVVGLAERSGNERFAYDCRNRFLTMYANVVLGVDHHKLSAPLEALKKEQGVEGSIDLDVESLKNLGDQLGDIIEQEAGQRVPEDPTEQLWGAISAVFGSWMNDRAIYYRKMQELDDKMGTAVNVQAMVFGNLGQTSATGVAFTRNPSNGNKEVYGEYLANAQGEDIVAGLRTPSPIEDKKDGRSSLETEQPQVYEQLMAVFSKLENHYRDVQDVEFTIEDGRLFLLQTRNGKRTAAAAIKIAVDMVDEGLIDQALAVQRVDPASLDTLLHPAIDEGAAPEPVATGLPASPGAAAGVAAFTSEEAVELAEKGQAVLLVRLETSPEDIAGMHSSRGILTGRGGMTSHAAVVARGMGVPCVSGAAGLEFGQDGQSLKIGEHTINPGDWVTIDGSTGAIFIGQVPMNEPEMTDDFAKLMAWADEQRTLRVRTNADTPADADTARKFGAEGIGLCRTEHMFFDPERIGAVREMILASDETERRVALDKIVPFQRKDFAEILEVMDGLPVTIRLLDPPLHEFLPHEQDEMKVVAEGLGVSMDELRRRAEALKEFNPMLGHRGCRLGVSYPEIYEAQVLAIYEAAAALRKQGKDPQPEVMIPLVGAAGELADLRAPLEAVAAEVLGREGVEMDVKIGTMVELPRACVTADEIAKHADFFSFGTNDLTQTTLGMSRDDSTRFLQTYVEKGIYERDPFASLDQEGVGSLIAIGVEKGHATRKGIKLGICGEHGGDPRSIDFCQRVGLDYVSCSPYRVPIARLAAAHAALANKG